MRKLWIWILITSSILLLFFIPLVVLKPKNPGQVLEGEAELCPITITVTGLDKPLPLEEYVKGVVSSEMPVAFHEEALKAQAIAARTYALKETDYGQKPIAPDVSAQVFSDETARKKKWGKEFARNEKKISAAVEATAGDVIIYGEEMISAMFFSTSNGKTETARNFGGNDIPYLQSVESPGEEDVAPSYEEKAEMSLKKWNEALGMKWNEDMFTSLQLIRNSTGRVQKITTTGFEASGREIREKLGLRSTDFDIAFDVTNNIVHITTLGYGHGVGMSQYGAEVFAQEGWSAKEIVKHYYTDTTIKKLTNSDPKCLKTP